MGDVANDARMTKLFEDAGFAEKPTSLGFGRTPIEHLDRDIDGTPNVAGTPHRGHAASADAPFQIEALREDCSGLHRCARAYRTSDIEAMEGDAERRHPGQRATPHVDVSAPKMTSS